MANGKPGFRITYFIFAVVLAAVLVLVNALATRFHLRFDMTRDKIFTISPSTESILSRLEDKVAVIFYTSEELPSGLENLRRDTIDKFKELEVISEGNFQYQIVEPLKSIREEELAKKKEESEEGEEEMLDPYALSQSEYRMELMRKGIRELQGRKLERDRLEVVNFFSALEISYLDRPAEVIPVYDSVDNLEYELASRILRLTSDSLPVIAFFDGNPGEEEEEERPQNPYMPPRPKRSRYAPVLSAFRDSMEIREVKLTETDPIPANVSCLVVAQPATLDDRQKYELNKYLSEGGNVVVLASRMSVDFSNEMSPVQMLEPGLDNLFSKWGIGIGDKLIGSLEQGMITLQSSSRGMTMRRTLPIPFMVRTGNENFDTSSPILRGVPFVTLPWCFPVEVDAEKLEANGLEYTELISTNREIWFRQPTPYLDERMLRIPTHEEDYKGKQTVAVLVRGKFPFIYEGKEVPEWPQPEEKEESIRPPVPPAPPDGPAPAESVNGESTATDTSEEVISGETSGATPAEPESVGAVEQEQPPREIAPQLDYRPGNLLLVGSSDLISPTYVRMREYQPNLFFFKNAAEVFSLGEELINIRAKNVVERSLEETTDAQRTMWKLLNIILVPLLLIAFGLARYLIRRMQKLRSI